MKQSLFIPKTLFVSIIFLCCAQSTIAQKIKKVLFVIVDGIPTDVVKKVNTPSLDAIAKVG